MRIKRIAWGVLAVLILVAAVAIIHINLVYPRSEKITIEPGTAVPYQGALFTVKDACWTTPAELPDGDPLYPTLFSGMGEVDPADVKILLIDIALENPTDQDLQLDMSTTPVEAGSFSMVHGQETMLAYNEFAAYPTIPAGEVLEAKVPIVFYRSLMSERQWKSLTQRQFYYALTLYPQKVMALIPAEG